MRMCADCSSIHKPLFLSDNERTGSDGIEDAVGSLDFHLSHVTTLAPPHDPALRLQDTSACRFQQMHVQLRRADPTAGMEGC